MIYCAAQVNDIVAYLGLLCIAASVAFIFFMEWGINKIKEIIKILRYGKEEIKKGQAEETKKAGRINARRRW